MVLGFFGKGGSGKSSVSTQVALHMQKNNLTVLAIDADHNMDLSYNLTSGNLPAMNYISESMELLKKQIGVPSELPYSDAFLTEIDHRFTLSPLDVFTKTFSTEVAPHVYLMTAGPQTDVVLYGRSCSHVLSTPLKVYLPLLTLTENEVVIVDEKAGADGVTTGIVTGIDVAIVVCEPALHSIKTAKQIAELMEFYGTPYLFVGNKVRTEEDKAFIESTLGVPPVIYLPQSTIVQTDPSRSEPLWDAPLSTLVEKAESLNKNDRLERSRAKFERNQTFASH